MYYFFENMEGEGFGRTPCIGILFKTKEYEDDKPVLCSCNYCIFVRLPDHINKHSKYSDSALVELVGFCSCPIL